MNELFVIYEDGKVKFEFMDGTHIKDSINIQRFYPEDLLLEVGLGELDDDSLKELISSMSPKVIDIIKEYINNYKKGTNFAIDSGISTVENFMR